MKVYSFTNPKVQPKDARLKKLFNSNKKSGYAKKVEIFNFLEHKLASQILAMLFLTVAVFIGVQGLLSTDSINTTAQAAGVNENVKLIINYNAETVANTNSTDNSKLVDALDVVIPQPSANPNPDQKLENLNSVKAEKSTAINKK